MIYDPTRAWNTPVANITFANDNEHGIYLKVPLAEGVTTSEWVVSEAHIDPLLYDGYIVYKMGRALAVSGGTREISMLGGNPSRLQDLYDVNGTPLSVNGQFPVWNQTGQYFDFDHNISEFTSASGFDHSSLSNLNWPDSGHIGIASSYAAFNASGSAFNVVYDVQALTGTTPTWNMTSGINASLSLSGNTTINFSNIEKGMSGNLSVTNPETLYTLSVTGYTNKISPVAYLAANQLKVSGSSLFDIFSWYYDGTYLWWNGGQDYK